MKKITAEELLEKNPDVREIFEENEKKRAQVKRGATSGAEGYGLALPYGSRKLMLDDRQASDEESRPAYYGR